MQATMWYLGPQVQGEFGIQLVCPHLVRTINLKLNAHLAAGLVGLLDRVNQVLVLVVCVGLCHHHVEHHTWIAVATQEQYVLRTLHILASRTAIMQYPQQRMNLKINKVYVCVYFASKADSND